MPSYFANPFMTPFMPQQASMTPLDQNNPEYRVNPLQADNYFLQSLHCQEMMQHYIQSLMAAASRLPVNNVDYNSPVSFKCTCIILRRAQ